MQLVGFLVGILMSEEQCPQLLYNKQGRSGVSMMLVNYFLLQRLVGSTIIVYITGLNVSTSRSKLKKNGPQLACRTS